MTSGFDESPSYVTRVLQVVQRYLVLVGVFIGITIVSTILVIVGFVLIVTLATRFEDTRHQMCRGFEDVAVKALAPLTPPAGAAATTIDSYRNGNAQKAAILREIQSDLDAHSGCRVTLR